jgi:hypothetical protein
MASDDVDDPFVDDDAADSDASTESDNNKRQCVRGEPHRTGLCCAAQDGSAEMSDLYMASMLRCPLATCRAPFVAVGLGKAMQCASCSTKFCVEHMATYTYLQDHFCGILYNGGHRFCFVDGCDHTSICRPMFTPEEKQAFDYRVYQGPVDTYNTALFTDLVGTTGTMANMHLHNSPIFEPAMLNEIQQFI